MFSDLIMNRTYNNKVVERLLGCCNTLNAVVNEGM